MTVASEPTTSTAGELSAEVFGVFVGPRLKGVSSRLCRLERLGLAAHYWKGMLWSPSYFAASCGGAPISILRNYIEQQQAV
jgi:REP element-mobilizing transposase RayT